jgi:hypothetical protein
MKTKFVLVACIAAFACACQQKQDMKTNNGQKNMDDQNHQERRKEMQQPRSCGSCEAEKVEKTEAPQVSATAATPEIKIEKAP